MHTVKKILRSLGPGFITGASDDDPSGIATYSQTGAVFGYAQLWTVLFSFPLMSVIQEMCGRIGMVTGRGLAGVIRTHYSRPVLYLAVLLLFVANTVNIGANLGAMASSLELLFDTVPFHYWLLIATTLTLILVVMVSYKVYARYLKFLAFFLLAYVGVAFVVKADWGQILHATLVPSFSWETAYIMNIVAILGTTISPYLFFWQTGEEVEEEVAHHKLRMMGQGVPKVTGRDLREMQTDTLIGMLFSNIVMFFIIVTTASTLHATGITSVETASQAAEALRPIAGDFAFLIFALGIIGTGLLAVPVLAGSASYAITETFGWKEGLYRRFNQAHGFYAVIAIATLIGLLINFTGIPPFRMLYYTAILNGIIAPPLLVLILLIANNKSILGTHTNKSFSNVFGILTILVMSGAAIGLLVTSLPK